MHMQQFSDGTWLNPPEASLLDDNGLSVRTGSNTDFWRNTHYGFIRDNGHFLQIPAPAAFTAMLTFVGNYQTLYDQAGIMLRIDTEHWIKVGIEHSDGMTNFSVVVTRENSDWSVIPQPLIEGPQSVRITRQGGAVIAHFRCPDGRWQLMRVADFPDDGHAMFGPMTCSPERAGFEAQFLELQLSEPIENPLHG